MTTTTWIVIAVVVVLALLLVAGLVLKRGAEQRHHKAVAAADGLRGEAAGRAPDVEAAALQAQRAEAEAEVAWARADRADETAAGAHQELAQEQAVQEDVVRRADATDPRVDTDADDYRPVTGPDLKGGV
jgi:outer membrane murein-binding lipoprotein Lpp